jgi:hypothetical protein
VLCIVVGFELRVAFVSALVLSLTSALWFAFDPFGFVHVSSMLALSGAALTTLCAACICVAGGSRWLLFIFLGAYLAHGIGIFYPSYFNHSVRDQRRYLQRFAKAPGSIPIRGMVAQVSTGVSYRSSDEGKDHLLPYSPFFYIPFTGLASEPHLIDQAMKHVALAATAATSVVVFCLTRLLLGPSAAISASLLSAFLPPMSDRLLSASWPAVVSHLFLILAITALAFSSQDPRSRRRLAGLAAATIAACFIDYSNLIFLLLLGLVASILDRRIALRTMLVLAAVAVPVLMLNGTFLGVLAYEILPGESVAAGVFRAENYKEALADVTSSFGYLLLGLAVLGTILAVKRTTRDASMIWIAYGLSALLFIWLQGAGRVVFRDADASSFVGPFLAISVAAAVDTLFGKGRLGKLAAVLILVGIVGSGIATYQEQLGPMTYLDGLE